MYISQQDGEFLNGHLESAGQPGSMPRLWLAVGALPSPYGGAVYPDDLSESFLAQANGFATLRQALPFAGHDPHPLAGLIWYVSIYAGHEGRRNRDASFLRHFRRVDRLPRRIG